MLNVGRTELLVMLVFAVECERQERQASCHAMPCHVWRSLAGGDLAGSEVIRGHFGLDPDGRTVPL